MVFTAEFYKFFWKELSENLTSSLNHAFEKGELSICQRRGLISLLPKKSKPTNNLNNLRPISLLNTDYKIATKVLARRLERVLPFIINPDQTGYIKGRYTGENIRLISDLIDYIKQKNIPGIAIFLDFRKAFDPVKWDYIAKVLDVFKFGEDFKRWVKVFYTDISSCVINNGFASPFFKLKRGVRQGCPLSGLLFVLAIELLALAIKNDPLIQGICVGKEEIKLTQYADDTTVFVKNTTSVEALLRLLEKFKKCSGLEINTHKSEALWLGSWKERLDKPFGFKWPTDSVYALGIHFSNDANLVHKLNFHGKLEKLEKILNSWRRRKLTLYGKINIIKTLGLSKLIFSASVLPIPETSLKK